MITDNGPEWIDAQQMNAEVEAERNRRIAANKRDVPAEGWAARWDRLNIESNARGDGDLPF